MIFTPDNEPYLGRESVYQFDKMILSAMEVNQSAASASSLGELSRLQRAACQLIPQGFSIALSIRELVRQGYLLSAEILLRPLVERTSTISYLAENEDQIVLWEAGWPHKRRPPLEKRLVSMSNSATADRAENECRVKAVLDYFNSMVHGDPISADRNLGRTSRGEIGYLSSKSLYDGEKCDSVCFFSASMLIVLAARGAEIFEIGAKN